MYGARAPIDFLNLIDEFCCVALLTVKAKTSNSFFFVIMGEHVFIKRDQCGFNFLDQCGFNMPLNKHVG